MSEPRYEFRIFADDLCEPASRLQRLVSGIGLPDVQHAEDLYIFSEACDDHIFKIRNETLDVKRLVKRYAALQQWVALAKYPFPLDGGALLAHFFAPIRVDPPATLLPSYELAAFTGMVTSHPGLHALRLEKERRQWRIGSVICEIDSVTVGAKTLKSICCEATDPEALKHLIERLGIGDMKNRSYLDLLQDFPD